MCNTNQIAGQTKSISIICVRLVLIRRARTTFFSFSLVPSVHDNLRVVIDNPNSASSHCRAILPQPDVRQLSQNTTGKPAQQTHRIYTRTGEMCVRFTLKRALVRAGLDGMSLPQARAQCA